MGGRRKEGQIGRVATPSSLNFRRHSRSSYNTWVWFLFTALSFCFPSNLSVNLYLREFPVHSCCLSFLVLSIAVTHCSFPSPVHVVFFTFSTHLPPWKLILKLFFINLVFIIVFQHSLRNNFTVYFLYVYLSVCFCLLVFIYPCMLSLKQTLIFPSSFRLCWFFT